MNEDLQKKLSRLDELIDIQSGIVQDPYCTDIESAYMHGMANGMILGRSIFDGSSTVPYIHGRQVSWRNSKIRHKCRKR